LEGRRLVAICYGNLPISDPQLKFQQRLVKHGLSHDELIIIPITP